MSDEIRIVVNAALEHCLNLCKSVTEAKDAEIARLKAAGNALRKALVCFNVRRHPRTSLSRDESERVVNEWDRIVGGQVEEVK